MSRRRVPPPTHLSTPPPETFTRAASSDWDADDEDMMSMDDIRSSRPPSAASGPYPISRPTLQDVLSNSAPTPWTLSAFTAYLSQNHCLENLEFTMDANRYRERYNKTIASKSSVKTVDPDELKYVKMLWQRLLDAYIMSDGSREINIPSNVRARILAIKYTSTPPRPEVLTEAIQIIYNLMEESVLVSFLNDFPSARPSHPHVYHLANIDAGVPTRSRSRRIHHRDSSRSRASPTSSIDIQTQSLSSRSIQGRRHAGRGSSGSTGDGSLTDDSMSVSSPGGEPMTPPTTPPGSDAGGSSPKGRSNSDTAWKKMLMWKKRDGRREEYQ